MRSRIKTVSVEKAIGKVLVHDVTCVIPGVSKGPVFRKGHKITLGDIKKLRDTGKENIFVFDLKESDCHEDEAAERFKEIAGKNIKCAGPSEGKVQFYSECNGLLEINKSAVDKINSLGYVVLTTLHSHISVSKDDAVAGMRVIPLVISRKKLDTIMHRAGEQIISVRRYSKKNIGLIVTGNEVASGRIKDGFFPVISKKIKKYNSKIGYYVKVNDKTETIKRKINEAVRSGCNFIIITGGMSVDPDDKTKAAITQAGINVVKYGVPVLPGNMFMVGYLGEIPVFGLPACALFYKTTVLDIFLPYAFSNIKIIKSELVSKGYGGFCRHCKACSFPECSFGKS